MWKKSKETNLPGISKKTRRISQSRSKKVKNHGSKETLILQDLVKSMGETKPPTHIIWSDATIVGTQKNHSQPKFYPSPPGRDRKQEGESSILVDLENNELDVGNECEKDVADATDNEAIIELRNGELEDNESAKHESTVATDMENKQLPPANNSQDKMAKGTEDEETAEVVVDVRIMDNLVD